MYCLTAMFLAPISRKFFCLGFQTSLCRYNLRGTSTSFPTSKRKLHNIPMVKYDSARAQQACNLIDFTWRKSWKSGREKETSGTLGTWEMTLGKKERKTITTTTATKTTTVALATLTQKIFIAFSRTCTIKPKPAGSPGSHQLSRGLTAGRFVSLHLSTKVGYGRRTRHDPKEPLRRVYMAFLRVR